MHLEIKQYSDNRLDCLISRCILRNHLLNFDLSINCAIIDNERERATEHFHF